MGPFTPTTQDSTIYTLAAQMMAALPVGATGDADRARIDKALDLVGDVQRMPDRPDLFLVTSQSTADTAYQVHQGQCNCPDASRRDARRCKHSRAVEIFIKLERLDAEQSDPTLTIRVDPDLPAQCSRCHTEAASPRHRGGLGKQCISAELFGAEV